MRFASGEEDLASSALITFSLLKLSQPGEFSSCFLMFVFFSRIEVCYLLFANSISMDDSTFCHLNQWRTSQISISGIIGKYNVKIFMSGFTGKL